MQINPTTLYSIVFKISIGVIILIMLSIVKIQPKNCELDNKNCEKKSILAMFPLITVAIILMTIGWIFVPPIPMYGYGRRLYPWQPQVILIDSNQIKNLNPKVEN
jgi:hypothetical protein